MAVEVMRRIQDLDTASSSGSRTADPAWTVMVATSPSCATTAPQRQLHADSRDQSVPGDLAPISFAVPLICPPYSVIVYSSASASFVLGDGRQAAA
ncbi:hypothetical protein V490_06902 [Pseudogymnoascus sp. VKM F-3557]|nr:hypothetical protein V490_06902 [Pseudogymnoascus sp. VKM F-3557]